MLRVMANILLSKTGNTTTPITVGINWVNSFLKRQIDLKTRFTRWLTYSRAKCEDPKLIREYFDTLQPVRSEYGIVNEDIYNFDETGFALGIIATAKVICSCDRPGKPSLIQPGNREWVTAVECISTQGFALPPLIIFKSGIHIQAYHLTG
jgi:hypothetical protein